MQPLLEGHVPNCDSEQHHRLCSDSDDLLSVYPGPKNNLANLAFTTSRQTVNSYFV